MKPFFNAPAAAAALLALAVASLAPAGAIAQNTPCYMTSQGARWEIGSGCTLDVASGGVITSSGKGAATANAGNSYAVTVNAMSGVVTTDSLSTAAAGSQAITVSDSAVNASSIVLVSRSGGTNSAGTPVIKAVPGSGSITITLDNKHASAAFNGTFVLTFLVL
ncbi:MAG: hypothetical protein P4L73_13450 [Caulobacteraceae bacterium]|nr:hypothetical protein [Caulobacteraceae bacterium]